MKNVLSFKISFLFIFILFFSCAFCFAQKGGEITGKVSDEITGEAIPFISVQVENESFTKGTIANENGIYYLNPIPSGNYKIVVSHFGRKFITENVEIHGGHTVEVNVAVSAIMIDETETIVGYPIPLIDPFKSGTGFALTGDDINVLPTTDIADIVNLGGGTNNSDGETHIRGARGEATKYIVDGMSINGDPGIPSSAIDYLEVITAGIPAKYGDTNGGIIYIETKSYFSH